MSSRISILKNKLIAEQTKRDILQADIKKKRKENKVSKKLRLDLKNSALVLEYLIDKNYGTIIELFEDTVTAGLQELFNDEYEFLLNADRSGDHMNCEFQVATDECPYYQDLRMNYGKSVQEIIACLLRILICYLDKGMPNVVLLDEPLSGSRGFRQDMAQQFLNKISKEFRIQIIMVTQNQDAMADRVIDLSKEEIKLIC